MALIYRRIVERCLENVLRRVASVNTIDPTPFSLFFFFFDYNLLCVSSPSVDDFLSSHSYL